MRRSAATVAIVDSNCVATVGLLFLLVWMFSPTTKLDAIYGLFSVQMVVDLKTSCKNLSEITEKLTLVSSAVIRHGKK